MKVLLIRFSSIGDVLLTTPVVRALERQLGARVHYLTKAAYAPLLAHNPHLERLWLLEDDLSALLPRLRAERFDFVADLHKNLRSFRVRWGLGVRGRSFPKLNWEKWLLVNFKVDRLPSVHIVERYFEAVKPLGARPDGEGLDFFFPPDWETDGWYLAGLTPAEPYLVFAIGAAHATKRLPLEESIQLCKRLPGPVVLLGGKDVAATGKALSEACPEKVIDRCGQTSLPESAALLRDARKVIAHDSGMMHLAAALRTEVISIWGNTVPAFGMTPYFGARPHTSHLFEVQGLPCRPCSKLGFARCPKGHFRCMRLQDLDAIARAAAL